MNRLRNRGYSWGLYAQEERTVEIFERWMLRDTLTTDTLMNFAVGVIPAFFERSFPESGQPSRRPVQAGPPLPRRPLPAQPQKVWVRFVAAQLVLPGRLVLPCC